MIRLKEKLTAWAIARVSGPHTKAWLALTSFAESSFFPVPPDFLLMAILLTKERYKWVLYATITTVFSVIGGLTGYLIGFLFFKAFGADIVAFYHLEEEMVRVAELFSNNSFFAIFSAAFTPIPYKIFTISAGLFEIPLLSFFFASVFGRGIRFFLVAFLMSVFGEKISSMLYKYFNIISISIIVILGVVFYALF